MNDTNRILEQKALRNVRALLDKLGVVMLVVGIGWWISSSRKAAVEAARRQQVACELDIWVAKSGVLVQGFRQANPEMPYREIRKLLERERPAVMAAAKAECEGRSSSKGL
jgi:DNA transposition AAA+ family ATPase